jgi:hypothetical protein
MNSLALSHVGASRLNSARGQALASIGRTDESLINVD